MNKLIFLTILASVLGATTSSNLWAGDKDALSIGFQSEVNSDYGTSGVIVTGASQIEDSVIHAALGVVQRLGKQDGDRSKNATVSIEVGGGFLFGEKENWLAGGVIKYDFDSLLTDSERLHGKDIYNRKGIKPGVYVMKYFGKEDRFSFKVTVVHDGYEPEATFTANARLFD